MALKSFGKNFSERLTYFANWKFNFQKTKVIGSLRYIDEAMNSLADSPFYANYPRRGLLWNDFFYDGGSHRGSLYFEEAYFINHMIDAWEFDISKLSKYEQQDYQLAVEKLKTWNTLITLMQDVEKFVCEIKRVQYIRRVAAFPQNFYIYHFPEFEWSIVSRYHIVTQQLEAHPGWMEKFKNEVEPHIKQLYDLSPIPLSQYQHSVFYGIDLHSYFL